MLSGLKEGTFDTSKFQAELGYINFCILGTHTEETERGSGESREVEKQRQNKKTVKKIMKTKPITDKCTERLKDSTACVHAHALLQGTRIFHDITAHLLSVIAAVSH